MEIILRTMAAYGLSVIVVAIGGSVFLFLAFPFVQVFRSTELFLLLTGFLLNAASNYAAVYVILKLCRLLDAEPARLMVMIPLVLTLYHGLKRITGKRGEAAETNDAPAAEADDVGPRRPAEGLPALVEYAMLAGDAAGLIIGMHSFLEYAPLY